MTNIFQTVLIFIYVVSMLLIIVGNTLVLLILSFDKLLQIPTNYFIISLTAADLIIGCFVVPSSLYEQITLAENPYKCNIVPYLQLVSIGASVYSLVGIGIDRYRAIVQSNKPKLSNRQVARIIIGIWVFALAYSLRTYAYYLQNQSVSVDIVKTEDNRTTNEAWSVNIVTDSSELTTEQNVFSPVMNVSKSNIDTFSGLCNLLKDDIASDVYERWCDLFILLLIPLAILIYCYVCIIRRLWGVKVTAMTVHTLRRKKRAVSIFLSVGVLFIITWAPFHLTECIFDTVSFINQTFDDDEHDILKQATIVLALCNSWMNPIVYVAMNNNFRSALRRMLRHVCKRNAVAPANNQETPPENKTLSNTSHTRHTVTRLAVLSPR